jgi:osmotically-inducible protein OsmY
LPVARGFSSDAAGERSRNGRCAALGDFARIAFATAPKPLQTRETATCCCDAGHTLGTALAPVLRQGDRLATSRRQQRKEQAMNQRYQQDPSRGRMGGRSDQDYARNMQGRGERFGRQYDDDSPRYGGAQGDRYGDEDFGYSSAQDTRDLRGGQNEQYYGSHPSEQGAQYYGSYPSEQGAQYYTGGAQSGGQGMQRGDFAPRGRMQGGPRPDYQGSPYGPEDFRQGSGQRPSQSRSQGVDYARQGQRQFVGGQGYNADAALGNGQFRQSRFQGGYSQGGGYARDYDEGNYDASYGGYSASQHGYGDSWSGYGRGGYGSIGGQGFDEDFQGTTNSSVLSGAFGQGPGGYGGGYSQGLAGRGGYGQGSGYIGQPSHAGKGPKGYTRSDERLKEDISERLTRDPNVDASDIGIDARNGNVTLTGSVADRRTKHYVEDLCEDCYGVQDIDNRLTVRPRSSRQQSGSGSPGGSNIDSGLSYTGQSAASGTSGSKASTGSASGASSPAGSGSSGEDGGSRSRN